MGKVGVSDSRQGLYSGGRDGGGLRLLCVMPGCFLSMEAWIGGQHTVPMILSFVQCICWL
jgi:hypothetical protein